MYIGETGNKVRSEFECYPIDWQSNDILIDIDTQEDYDVYSKFLKE